ncbi:Uncharacterised protein [Enterobacter cloacae]|nr:Uncharacterised protein [Enterobacter cloacae]
MTRVIKDLIFRPLLYAASQIHHHHLIGNVLNHRQVMGDENVRQPKILL